MENSISLSPCRRQQGSRYTTLAGCYLCDKEFCYLMTVKVTAAIYWAIVKVHRFRLAVGTPHLHGEFNFTKSLSEIAGHLLHHSSKSLLMRQGISLPQDSYSYCRHLPGLPFKGYNTFPFDHIAPGRSRARRYKNFVRYLHFSYGSEGSS
ncbi:hypothetical protein Syun_001226 [Stephania yunnanensis]|uniref:Uncharacterized protein n=1 Tax=Stephania yunnanensis TaxID=152371 RepID=A0AAP0LDI5_9MAGN